MEECISTLESVARNPSDHSEFADEYKVALAQLSNRCQAFARLYGNPEFNVLYHGAAKALGEYEGRENIQTKAFVEEHLRKYAFIITTRMWTKLEILLLMCILLDASLVYRSINQTTEASIRRLDLKVQSISRTGRVLVILRSACLFLT